MPIFTVFLNDFFELKVDSKNKIFAGKDNGVYAVSSSFFFNITHYSVKINYLKIGLIDLGQYNLKIPSIVILVNTPAYELT